MAREKLPIYVTPAGIAQYPWLTKPDTKFNADGEYRIGLILDEATAQPLVEKLEALRDAAVKAKQAENPKIKVKTADSPVKPLLDKDKNEVEGKVVINFKMKAKITSKKTGEWWEQRPRIEDAQGTVLVNPKLGAGSTVKIAFEAVPYLMASTKEAGISMRLKQVRVLNLVEFGGQASAFGGAEEGYGADEDQGGDPVDNTDTTVKKDEEADF